MTNFLYNPDRKGKEQLIAEFVVRTNILDEIMHDLETSKMKVPEQHYLLVGQRGSGKTTLLNRIKYAVEDSEKLKEWLIPVIFNEEQYNISELANLWENVGQILDDYYGFEDVSERMLKHVNDDDFEEKAYDILEKELNSKGKKLLLLIDNVGDFLRKLEDKEVRRLREILQTKPSIRLIAGSPFYLESILDYKQPFFEFFKVMRLDSLTQAETRRLLETLGEIYDQKEQITRVIKGTPERIETLRILTGGVPRTMALMFNILVDYEHDSSIKDLEKILDAVTPLYKHRMDDLPTQQQKIVDAVARNWDPIGVGELKGRIRLDSKTISAQLRQLEKNQVVEKRETNSKNHLYLLKERFFNIWYLMRYGRKHDRERVIWLVRFLESWCTESDIEKRVLAFAEKVKNKAMSAESINFFAEVYASMETLTTKAKSALKKTDLPGISSEISFTDPELIKLAQESLAAKEFTEAINWIANVSVLTEVDKGLVVGMLFNASSDIKSFINLRNSIQGWLNDVDGNPATMTADKYFTTKVQIAKLLSLYIFFLEITALEPDQPEKALGIVNNSLMLIAYQYLAYGDDVKTITVEIAIFNAILNQVFRRSLLNVIMPLFDYQLMNKTFKHVLEPIYQALLIITHQIDYLSIPPEKEELIRNIAARITQKD